MTKRLRIWFLILIPVAIAVLLQLSPQPIQTRQYIQEADWAFLAGYYDLAAKRYSEVLKRQSWRIDLLEKTGRSYYRSGDSQEAQQYFWLAEQAQVLSIQGKLDLAEIYAQAGNTHQSMEIWTALVENKKAKSRVFPKLVEYWRKKGDLAKTIEILMQWKEFEPGNDRVKYQLALIYFAYNPEQAASNLSKYSVEETSWKPRYESLSKAISLALLSNPQGAFLWLKVGRALASLGEWDLAALVFQKAIDTNPSYAEAWAFLGEANQNLGKDGLADLQKAQQLNPDSVMVKALTSVYWRRQGKPEVGLVYLQSVAHSEPDQPIWQVELGNTLVEMGDLISALAHFQAAVHLEPANPIYWLKLGEFCAENGVEINTIGLNAARQAVLIAPHSAEALDMMGRLLFLSGDSSSGERFLQRALEQDPDFIPAHFHLGQLYLKEDRFQPSYEHLLIVSRSSEKIKEVSLAKRLLASYFPNR